MNIARHWSIAWATAILVLVPFTAGVAQDNPSQEPPGPEKKEPAEEVDKIAAALDGPAELRFTNANLTTIAAELQKQLSVPVDLDRRALVEAGLDDKATLTWSIRGVSYRSALRRLLGDIGLTYAISNEVLLITTPVGAARLATVRTYDVKELLVEGDSAYLLANAVDDALTKRSSTVSGPWATSMTSAYGQTPSPTPGASPARTSVRAEPPRVRYITPYQNVLIVRDTTVGHEEIEELLKQLKAKVHFPPETVQQAPYDGPAQRTPDDGRGEQPDPRDSDQGDRDDRDPLRNG